MNASRTEEDWVVVAKIVRPQGRHGELLADLLTDFPERFAERKQVFLLAPKTEPRGYPLEDHWLHQGRIVFKLSGIDSINDAEALRGCEIAIPRHERAPLEDGAVYIDDLIGCGLLDTATGKEVGEISSVDRDSTTASLLVIETTSFGQVLVPFVKAFQPVIDLAARRISMRLPEGLLELNTRGREDAGTARRADGASDESDPH